MTAYTARKNEIIDADGKQIAIVIPSNCSKKEACGMAEIIALHFAAGEVAKDAEILRALLTQYVEADEDRLGWTQCMKSQLYREALKTLDSAQVLPTKE